MKSSPSDAAPLYLRKDEDRRLLAGHAWIYSNEIDTARSPLKAFEPGQAVEVVSQRGQWLAHAYVNPHSLITARVLSRHKDRPFDSEELAARLAGAMHLRERLYPANYYRWAYGESDGLPGLVVDRYGEFAVAQITTAGMERWREAILEVLAEQGPLKGVLIRSDSDLRSLENLSTDADIVHGTIPDEVEIEENGIRYLVPLATGQKTGWFYDQADNRRHARALLSGGMVVDAFSYIGGWGLTAALAGAERVVCIDSSERALDHARRSAERNGAASRMTFLRSDVGEALREMKGKASPAAIVLDPPAFVKRKRDLETGSAAYQRLNEQALGLLGDGGVLVTCSCSQHVDRDRFLRLVQKAAQRANQALRLIIEGGQSADHPVHPAMPETRYLKALVLDVRPG